MQLEDNLSVFNLDLTEEEIQRLNQVSEPEHSYPYRFFENYAMR
jgi:hypothetical protein